MDLADNLVVELELTYLAKYIPQEVKSTIPKQLVDIYLPDSAEAPCLRLRQTGDSFEITKKQPIDPSDFSRQTEQTIPLDEAEFRALAVASERRVEKARYAVTIDGHAAEVDVFGGNLKGLVVIDFEFDSVEDKQTFQAPDCCLVDVTQELFIAGGQLAGKAFADIEPRLEAFNYQPLPLEYV